MDIDWITSREEYETRLKSHDWFYDFSDAIGSGRWKRGFNQRKALEDARSKFDQNYAMWNDTAPSTFKRENYDV